MLLWCQRDPVEFSQEWIEERQQLDASTSSRYYRRRVQTDEPGNGESAGFDATATVSADATDDGKFS